MQSYLASESLTRSVLFRCDSYNPIRVHAPRRRVRASTSAYGSETLPPPIPPPPPPPPPPQDGIRRVILQTAAFGAAGLLGGLLLGRSQQGPNISSEEQLLIDQVREDNRFKRDYEGHVFVQGQSSMWYEVKLDAKLPGTLLLRDRDGFIYTCTASVQQVDLTEDLVVAAIFGDGTWESSLQALQGADENGQMVRAALDQETFRDFISISD